MWQTARGDDQPLYVSHRSAGSASWTPPRLQTSNPTAPVIGADDHGGVTIAWSDQHGGLWTAASDNGIDWHSPTPVPHAGGAFISWLSVGASGDAILTWVAGSDRVLASTRPAAEARWTRPALIGYGSFSQAALDRAGTAAIVWPRITPKRFAAVIQAASYSTR